MIRKLNGVLRGAAVGRSSKNPGNSENLEIMAKKLRARAKIALPVFPQSATFLSPPKPAWRNWQTRATQNRVPFRSVGSIPSAGRLRVYRRTEAPGSLDWQKHRVPEEYWVNRIDPSAFNRRCFAAERKQAGVTLRDIAPRLHHGKSAGLSAKWDAVVGERQKENLTRRAGMSEIGKSCL